MKKHLGRWTGAFLVLGVVAFYLLKPPARHSSAGRAPRAVPVLAATAQKGDLGVYVQALGTVTPVYTVNVTARVQGQIMSVLYQEGQLVKKGDALLEIDPRPYAATVLQAEGQLAHDIAVLREARIDLQRYRRAYAKNAIQKQLLDDQEQTVFQEEGTVKADEGVLASAKVNLDYCHIMSPITGRVGLRLVDPGNVVQAGATTALLVITQLQPITVIFNVAEDYLPSIQEQLHQSHSMPVEALDRAQEKKLATGKFLTTDNQVDTTTGTVRIKAIFDNEDGKLFPNQFVNARLLLNTLHGATLISSAAIQRGPKGTYVYVIKPDKTAEMRQVQVDNIEAGEAAVAGINPGEVVATSGFDKLEPGSRVSIGEQAQLAGTAGPGLK